MGCGYFSAALSACSTDYTLSGANCADASVLVAIGHTQTYRTLSLTCRRCPQTVLTCHWMSSGITPRSAASLARQLLQCWAMSRHSSRHLPMMRATATPPLSVFTLWTACTRSPSCLRRAVSILKSFTVLLLCLSMNRKQAHAYCCLPFLQEGTPSSPARCLCMSLARWIWWRISIAGKTYMAFCRPYCSHLHKALSVAVERCRGQSCNQPDCKQCCVQGGMAAPSSLMTSSSAVCSKE